MVLVVVVVLVGVVVVVVVVVVVGVVSDFLYPNHIDVAEAPHIFFSLRLCHVINAEQHPNLLLLTETLYMTVGS